MNLKSIINLKETLLDFASKITSETTDEEKEQIVLDYLQDRHQSGRKTADKYGIGYALFCDWLKRYRENGIDGFKSQTGKAKHPNKGNPYCSLQRKKNKTREEELELENLKLKVENARLKKGTK